MIAGLPGTGIGGVFYILSALLMPLHRLARGGGRDGRSWRRVGAQAGIAAGIMLALFFTGWGVGLVLAPPPEVAGADTRTAGFMAASAAGAARWVAVVGTLGMLSILLVVVELAALGAGVRSRLRSGELRGPEPEIEAGDGMPVLAGLGVVVPAGRTRSRKPRPNAA